MKTKILIIAITILAVATVFFARATETVPQTQSVLKSYFTTGSVPTQNQYDEFIDTMFYYANICASNAAVAQGALQSLTNSGFLTSIQFCVSGNFSSTATFDANRHIFANIYNSQNVYSLMFSNIPSSQNVDVWIACLAAPPANLTTLAGVPASSGPTLTNNLFTPPIISIVNGTNIVIRGSSIGLTQGGSGMTGRSTNVFILGLR